MRRAKIGQTFEKNGVGVTVHDIKDGQVYYQKWPAGVTRQGMFDNLHRMPESNFNEQISQEIIE